MVNIQTVQQEKLINERIDALLVATKNKLAGDVVVLMRWFALEKLQGKLTDGQIKEVDEIKDRYLEEQRKGRT